MNTEFEPPLSVLQAIVHGWAARQFGPDREDAAWKKLFEELGEVIRDPEDAEEWADVLIILLDLAKMNGVTNLAKAVALKMAKNEGREWTRSKTGVMIHVKQETYQGIPIVADETLSSRPEED